MGPSEATFRFYAELNDFLPKDRRQRDLTYAFLVPPSVKDAIESFGVPHVEVDVILVNGISVGFEQRLAPDDRVAVYPMFESLDVTPLVHLSGRPLRATTFVADVHLRKLACLLRLMGFDVSYANDADDPELVESSLREGRILLTRDRALLKHGRLTHGTWVRAIEPIEQACEIVQRLDIAGQAQPFTRCTACNGLLASVDKDAALERIPPKTAAWLDEYLECIACNKLYWRGTHHERLVSIIDRILHEATQEGD
ncbi:Mut7-C ubiquitin/RNAse domain-containing protein [Candidatus Bipolaricaulota bacterium]|nr:Mut7-C ubiquitin/RNAse domain-containing protein [Candidatus Bipolaricaulota bacterium]